MKKVFLAAAVMSALASTSVFADTITINGEMIEEGCIIGDNGGSEITLDKITAKQVKDVAVGGELLNQADSFKISNCPNYDVRIEFSAQTPTGYPDAIVNTDTPSGEFVAHYLRDGRTVDHKSLTNLASKRVYLANDEAIAAQTVTGFQFPVLTGYTKIKEVGTGESPVGTTTSTVNLSITYVQ
ncbi:fimbrial protein [Citrobacter sp. U14242]|uniref:fimbrial protein n=1 Tax=Citrobacter sp. U14242 TaxID=3390192 RepID=UPI00397D54A0